MSQDTSTLGMPSGFNGDSINWVSSLPDGAVSVEKQDGSVVLRASQALQNRLEELLERQKSAQLSPDDSAQYAAICELDDALSWLNRLSRDSTRSSGARIK